MKPYRDWLTGLSVLIIFGHESGINFFFLYFYGVVIWAVRTGTDWVFKCPLWFIIRSRLKSNLNPFFRSTMVHHMTPILATAMQREWLTFWTGKTFQPLVYPLKLTSTLPKNSEHTTRSTDRHSPVSFHAMYLVHMTTSKKVSAT